MRVPTLFLGPVTVIIGKRQLTGWSIALRIGSREWEFGAVNQTGGPR